MASGDCHNPQGMSKPLPAVGGQEVFGEPRQTPGAAGAVAALDAAEGEPEGAGLALTQQLVALLASCCRHWLQLCPVCHRHQAARWWV